MFENSDITTLENRKLTPRALACSCTSDMKTIDIKDLTPIKLSFGIDGSDAYKAEMKDMHEKGLLVSLFLLNSDALTFVAPISRFSAGESKKSYLS